MIHIKPNYPDMPYFEPDMNKVVHSESFKSKERRKKSYHVYMNFFESCFHLI